METAKHHEDESQDNPPAELEAAQDESMEALLAQEAATKQKLASRQIAWVKIIQVTADQVLVDVGEKREGIIDLSEFSPSQDKPAQPPAVGQRVPVLAAGKTREGATKLSYRRAKAELAWQSCQKAFQDKVRVRGRVTSAIKGGFLVDLGGVQGFLPASLADLRPVREPSRMVGTGVRCVILELNDSKRQAVLSRKAVLEEEVGKRKQKVLSELKAGEIRIGRVVRVAPEGLTVDIGGLEGLVRTADISWGAPAAPSAQQRGTKVRVKVLSKPAQEAEKVLLGIKQLLPNPVDAVRKKYPLKSVVRGKVLEAGPAGVRIAVGEKQKAFCPVSECDPEASCKAGDAVSGFVIGVNAETFEILFSMAKFNEIQDKKRVAQYLKAPRPLTLGQVLGPEQEE